MPSAIATLAGHPNVLRVLSRVEACALYDLPSDRIGDLVVVATENSVFGRTPEYHDLEVVPRLRSHGGESEQWVPLLVNRPLTPEWTKELSSGTLRNYDLFDILLNGVALNGVALGGVALNGVALNGVALGGVAAEEGGK